MAGTYFALRSLVVLITVSSVISEELNVDKELIKLICNYFIICNA